MKRRRFEVSSAYGGMKRGRFEVSDAYGAVPSGVLKLRGDPEGR